MQEKDAGILIEITCIYILPKIEVIANSYKKEKEYMYTCLETKYAASILDNTRKISRHIILLSVFQRLSNLI